MRTTTLALALALVVALPAALARATSPEEGRSAIARLGCPRCHAVPGFVADVQQGCVACHQQVLSRGRSGLRRTPRVEHFVRVPDLSHVTWRVRAEYLVAYIQDPHDLRPHLSESMPRLPVSLEDARNIVAYLASRAGPAPREPSPRPDPANLARGRQLFVTAGCPTCHTFGNVDFGTQATEEFYRSMRREALLAPNLRFVRERMDPSTALRWLIAPTSVDPTTTMPALNLGRDDALAIRDFLYLGDTGRPVVAPRPPTVADVAPLDRPVTFAEVRRIFGRGCIHCHSHASRGASQALGFTGLRVDLSTRRGVLAGATGADGQTISVLSAPDGGPPPLVARLLRRHAEAARDEVPVYHDSLTSQMRPARDQEPVGMPLGLPAVPLDDVRLVATWIAQGTPP